MSLDFTTGQQGILGRLSVERPAGGFIRPYQSELGVVGRVIDLLWVAVALWVGLKLYQYPWEARYSLLLAMASVLYLLLGEFFGIHRKLRTDPLRSETFAIVGAWSAVVVAILFLGYAFKVTHLYSRLAIGSWFLLTPVFLGSWRGVVRAVSSNLRMRGYNTRSVAIVGAGAQGLGVAEAILGAPWMGLRFLGIYDDRARSPERLPADMPGPLLGTLSDLLEKARQHKIDIVYITTIPISDHKRIAALLEALADTTVSVYIVPDLFLFTMFHGSWVQVGKLPAVSVFETPFYGADGWIKRAEDIVIATIAVALFAVPMLLIAIAVKVTSPGPVLFKQRRYGLDGSEFRMWKFRTMTVCEDGDEIQQAQKGDRRVTPLGRFLRRASFDELPQFFNVLGGSMSVVGPRPHAASHNEYYRKLIKRYMVRHKVRPGITGWAQANGWRGETGSLMKMEARVEYDLWYIRNWTLFLDLKIILVTLFRGWRGENTY